jgi:hypothetical protein
MNHHRVLVFRDALANLLESLEAVVQVAKWNVPEPTPEPISSVASKLQVRLASAGRLAAGKFNGTQAEMPNVASICGKITQLEGAYLTYCRSLRGNEPPATALRGLSSAIEDARKSLA